MEKLTLRQLGSHLWAAADILRGSIDAADFKHYIFGLLFYKRLSDVYDEEYADLLTEGRDEISARNASFHRFQIPAGHSWNDMRERSTDIGAALKEAFAAITRANGDRLEDIFDDIDFGNVVFATVHSSYNLLSSRLPAMQFWGSKGALTAPQFLGDEVGVWRCGNTEWEIVHLPPTLYDRLGVAAGLPHWLDCIREGKQSVNSGRHGRHLLDILLAAQTSARTGQAVELTTTF